MKKAVLVCGWQDDIPSSFDGDVVGIDRGAWLLARQKTTMAFAIGDFDSIEDVDKQEIETYAKQTIVLSTHKDVSDTEAAIDECIRRGYGDIVLWGGLGGRFDHAWVNLLLLRKHPSLRLLDTQNEVFTLGEGTHDIGSPACKYVSVFALLPSEVSLVGFVYPLSHAMFEIDTTLGLSNEIQKENARIIVHSGRLMIILSQDK
ncbi:MAG TPA: thiamine diphosphokinase [Erysipelotrichaceae bacterium]|nr:thiamine diphosphokinase [Erysipelotrichaceae bacterium]